MKESKNDRSKESNKDADMFFYNTVSLSHYRHFTAHTTVYRGKMCRSHYVVTSVCCFFKERLSAVFFSYNIIIICKPTQTLWHQ